MAYESDVHDTGNLVVRCTHVKGKRRAAVTEPVWTKPKPGSRRPRVSRDQIAAAALAIADAEGIDAVSMRRVAAEVGLGTMSLYHYVPSKHDLLTLIGDAIMTELILPDGELGNDWRTRLAQIARRTRSVWQRHPWAIGFLRDARLGPNGMRNLEQSLVAVADVPLGPADKLELVSLIEDYVLGFVLRSDLPEAGSDTHDWVPSTAAWITEQLQSGSFPHAEEVFGNPDPETVLRQLGAETNNEERFERGLTRLLDGIAPQLHDRTCSNVP
jgi:AcrR family transcriptional regulator